MDDGSRAFSKKRVLRNGQEAKSVKHTAVIVIYSRSESPKFPLMFYLLG
jgi:hypothetical protein